jgi:hypothetical protein
VVYFLNTHLKVDVVLREIHICHSKLRPQTGAGLEISQWENKLHKFDVGILAVQLNAWVLLTESVCVNHDERGLSGTNF